MVDQWTLEVRFGDSLEKAGFASKQEAYEHARAVIRDYDGSVEVAIYAPSGKCELMQQEQAFARTWVQ